MKDAMQQATRRNQRRGIPPLLSYLLLLRAMSLDVLIDGYRKRLHFPLAPPSSDVGFLQVAITMGLYAGISLVEAGCLGQTSTWCSGLALMEYAVRSLVMLTTVVAINYHITHIRGCIQVQWSTIERDAASFQPV